MSPAEDSSAKASLSTFKLVITWIRLTWLGWLLGIPIIVVLALIGEGVGIGGSQTIVGAGMGLGVGLLQSRVVRTILFTSKAWILSSTVGLSIPFLFVDVSNRIGLSLPYSLPAAVGLGGLIVGVWQSSLLRNRTRGTSLWIPACLAGWLLASGASSVGDTLVRSSAIRGIWGALAYLGAVLFGGIILGAVTGFCLRWMLRRNESREA